MSIRRGVLRHSPFEKGVKALSGTYERLPEVIDGLAWELSRQPTLGKWLKEYDVWQIRVFVVPDSVIVYYAFTPRLLSLLLIEPSTAR